MTPYLFVRFLDQFLRYENDSSELLHKQNGKDNFMLTLGICEITQVVYVRIFTLTALLVSQG